jgi:hypothetical protein
MCSKYFLLFFLAIPRIALAQADSSRYVRGQDLISTNTPVITLHFEDEFKFAGTQSFVLFNSTAVTQFYFVKSGRQKKVVAFYTIEFDQFLPNNNKGYYYHIKDSIPIGSTHFLYTTVYNQTYKVLVDSIQSEAWYKFSFLRSKDHVLPSEVMGYRFAKVTDRSKRSEILIIYTEGLENYDTTGDALEIDNDKLDQVKSQLLQNALKGFTIVTLKE